MGCILRLARAQSAATLGLVGALLAAACGPGGRPPVAPPPSLSVQIQSDMANRDAFAWAAGRPLAWPDFSASAPVGGDEGALTAYSVFYGVRCTGVAFDFLAVAGFLPHDSWVKPDVAADPTKSARMLRHEQTHFDLTEVFVRRLRKSFVDLYQPCRRTTTDLDAQVTGYLQAEKAEQQRYDAETSHGLVATAQATWDHQVASQLAELAAFAR